MPKKLSKKDLEKKKKYHDKKSKYYQKKIECVKKEETRIGFKWYN